jgi:PAS domain S-box-containing protein
MVLDRQLTFVNQRCCEMAGYTADELIGRNARLLYPDQKEFEWVGREKYDQISQTGTATMETRWKRKDGTIIHVLLNFAPLDASDRSKGDTFSALDFTEKVKTDRELAQYRDHLEAMIKKRTAEINAKNKELEMFTYSVSHDLKAPLRGIDGYSRLLVEEYSDKLDEDGLFFLNNVRQGTTQMNTLIEDLLAYSRMERKQLHYTSIDLKSLIDNLVNQRIHDIELCQITLKIAVPFHTIESDTETLRQVLSNYLDNAIKYSKKDASGTVTIGGSQTDDHWTLWVKDDGIGFDPKYLDRIFDIFQRLHRVEEYPGTGIGLAIVRKAVERIGGRVRANSAPGKGSTFYLDIPKSKQITS